MDDVLRANRDGIIESGKNFLVKQYGNKKNALIGIHSKSAKRHNIFSHLTLKIENKLLTEMYVNCDEKVLSKIEDENFAIVEKIRKLLQKLKC